MFFRLPGVPLWGDDRVPLIDSDRELEPLLMDGILYDQLSTGINYSLSLLPPSLPLSLSLSSPLPLFSLFSFYLEVFYLSISLML